MGIKKYIESPEVMWELDLPKNQYGNYIVVPKKREYSKITKNNKEKNPNGYIYFIRYIKTDFYKLKINKNPKRRIYDIDSYLPFDLEILSLHFFKDIYEIKEKISNLLKNHKIRKK
jgi:hypothetical protein